MEVTIDIIKCAKYNVTPNEYIILKLLKDDLLQKVEEYIDYKSCLSTLEEKGFLDNQNIITHLGLLLLNVANAATQWEEFKNLYPKTDGARRLHNRPSICKEKFKKILKDHTFFSVIEGLKNEIFVREKAKSKEQWIENWQLMSTYLNNLSWETYSNIDVVDEDQESIKKFII